MTSTVKQVYQYGNQSIEYDVIKSKRVKTSEIIVDENRIVIRTPSNKPQLEIDKMVERKARWILDKQKEYRTRQKEINRPAFESGSTLPYLGRNYSLEVSENYQGYPDLRFQSGKFVFLFRDNESSRNRIKVLYEEWLERKANIIFNKKVKEYSTELNVDVKKLVIKKLKDRWGSITKAGVISLNLNLLKAPSEVIDYIIIHELCHVRIRSHSHHFWNQIKMIMPLYQKHVLWLARNASLLVE
jgi:predicted metal-dependent hydrolase